MKREREKLPESREKKGVAARLGEWMEIPTDILSGQPHVELFGNREIMIDGCRGILEYGETFAKLDCGGMVLTIRGQGICINSFVQSAVNITGVLTDLDFS